MTSKKIAQLKCIRFAAVPAAILCAFSAHAEPFDTGSWKGALDTQITVGAGFRLRDPAGYLIGDPTVNSGAATGVWSFGDNGDLNYKKNHAFSGYVKLTSELLAHNEPTGLDIMARGTAFYDPVAADTYRTELSGDAAAQVVHNTQLLDLWVGHKFSVDDKQWRVRVGNQVINWGESVFLFGGINASSAIDFQKSLIPGTQIKEYVLPAPLISVAGQLGDGWNAEGYYQMFWNQNKYPAIGSYWSTSDFFGRGVSDAVTFWTANPNLAGLDAAAFARLNSVSGNFCNSAGTNCITSLGGATGRGGAAATGRISSVTLAQINSDILNGYYANYPTNATNPAIGAVWGAGTLPTINPGNSGQFGLALHRKAEGSTVDYGLYYLHYTDKSPVFSIVGDSTVSAGVDYQASYLKNRDLFGVSTNFPLGPWAIGA
ncbi:MAG: DUF1302 family protein, partial [Paucibacter sp.]|nr:DUF1302 family protein [Roseateles sp.]